MAEPIPDAVIGRDGKPRFGFHVGRIPAVNIRDLGGPGRSFWAYKRWHFVGVFHPDLALGCAVIHLNYMSSAFAYAFERSEARLTNHELVGPPPFCRWSGGPSQGENRYKSGKNLVRLKTDSSDRLRTVEIRLKARGKQGPLTAFLEVNDSDEHVLPVNVVCPIPSDRVNFTHKAAGLPVRGTVEVSGRSYDIRPDRLDGPEGALAIVDWTCGYLARETLWRWACAAGRTGDGRHVGLNLVEGINDAGDETECTVWLDGRPHNAGRVSFRMDERNLTDPWTIRSADGDVDLSFAPEGMRSGHTDLRIVKSNFNQPVGTYTGHLPDGEGGRVEVSGITGVAEYHEAKW